MNVYNATFLPHLNYCNIIWGSANMSALDPLIKLQKKAIRLVNNSHYIEHTAPIFLSLKVLTINQVFKLNCLVFMFKCLKTDKFPEFKKRLIKNSNIHFHNTRKNNHYRPPRERLEMCKRSYFVQSILMWNSIDASIQISSTISIFKQNVKKLLLQNAIL